MKDRRIVFWAGFSGHQNRREISGIVCDKVMSVFALSDKIVVVDFYLVKEILPDKTQKIHRVLPIDINEIY